MTAHAKMQFQTLGAGVLAFAVVVGLGSLVLLHHGGAAVAAPVSAYAPVDAASAFAVPARAVRPASDPAASSPAPLLTDEERPADAAAPAASVAPGASTPVTTPAAAPKLVVSRHLDVSSSAGSSAAAGSTPPKPKLAAAKKAFVAPKLDLSKSQGTVASTVHYGVASRSELMGRAAGPVYNFAGKAAGQQKAEVAAGSMAPDVAAGTAGALQQVDKAQKQLDSSNVAPEDKAKLDQNLNQVRQSVNAVPAP